MTPVGCRYFRSEDARAAAMEHLPKLRAIHDAAETVLDERVALARAEILSRPARSNNGPGYDLSIGPGCFGLGAFPHPNENVTLRSLRHSDDGVRKDYNYAKDLLQQ